MFDIFWGKIQISVSDKATGTYPAFCPCRDGPPDNTVLSRTTPAAVRGECPRCPHCVSSAGSSYGRWSPPRFCTACHIWNSQRSPKSNLFNSSAAAAFKGPFVSARAAAVLGSSPNSTVHQVFPGGNVQETVQGEVMSEQLEKQDRTD